MSQHVFLTEENNQIYINVSVPEINIQDFKIDYGGYGGIKRLSVILINTITNERETVVSRDPDTFQRKASRKVEKWLKKQRKDNGKLLAELRTKEAELEREKLFDLLKFMVQENLDIRSEVFHKSDKYDTKKPQKPSIKRLDDLPNKPSKSSFSVDINFFDNIFVSSKKKKINRYKNAYRNALQAWEKEKKEISKRNKEKEKWNKQIQSNWEERLEKWEIKKANFYKEQEIYNQKIDKLFNKTLEKPSNIEEYFKLTLSRLDELLPETFDNDLELEYRNGTLILNYLIPNQEDLPTLEKVTYIISRDDFTEKYINNTKSKKLYERTIYGLVISVIHYVFEVDKNNTLEAVAVNGISKERNKKTGKKQTKTVLSIQVERDEFEELDLLHVDPKECFKGLKGISSGTLVDKVPIKPIMKISKDNSRFIENENVIDTLNDTNNLAAMDWQDFEHLIRDIFEKEFSKNGGEVNVTQSSRDQGVDAIAYDPDPIKGGKLVIQAKRYTNTVGVQYVRDLYGTVINEGANRGILITTSDYGSESHNFVKDKPLSLINGQELLYLLKKHGYSAKIDIAEAKKVLGLGDQ
ncbi:restriction endonuclease [Gracilimonas sp.]|uniref:restriction endonuclease n=1 Tax=Gracilimonas sp. TaxID=1974203 RepID=UPI0028720279|nr:restriction endonuclease [Gracilimonas sp.]